jgi:hypothetical protein
MLENALWILASVAGLILLDQLFLWMEAKGWVYYRKVKRKSGFGDIFIASDIFDPGARHAGEARQERPGEEDEDDGDDDGKRKPRDRVG